MRPHRCFSCAPCSTPPARGFARARTLPPQALEFHHALLEQGKTSALLIYTKEGHGVRSYPAAFDFAARVVGWFEQHAGAKPG